ncbi:hypothetical protein MCOR34_004502 [Pyricularia oryzae]|nr:hypothetical protein MCOR34_004502 [Pyricularia oryzae]KAI6446402.1 hypothetical protein MCOR17_010779 [Pyricularia oryzae]KAI6505196.1 hypothetical protein MCOR13_004401 [Pyricularia oryzae]
MNMGQGSHSAYYWTPMNNIGGFLTSEDLLDMDSCLNLDGNMSTTDSMSTDGVEHCNMFSIDPNDELEIKKEHSPAFSFLPGDQGTDAVYASAAGEELDFRSHHHQQQQPHLDHTSIESLDGTHHHEQQQQLRSLSPSSSFDANHAGSNSDTEILRFEHLSVHSPRKPAAVPASAPVSRRGSPRKVTDRLAGVCSGIYKKASATLGRAGTHHQRQNSRSASNGLRQKLEREGEHEEGLTVAPLNIHRAMPTYEGLPLTPPLSGRGLTQQQQQQQPFVSGPVEDPFSSKPNPAGRQQPIVLPETPSGTPLMSSQDMTAAQQAYATANYAAMPVTSAASIDPELWAAAQFKLSPQFWDGSSPTGLPHVESAVPSPLAIDRMDTREGQCYAFAASAASVASTATMMVTRKQSNRNLAAAQANQHGTVSMSQLDLTNDGLMIHMPQPRGPPHAATLLAMQQQHQQQLMNQYHHVHQQQQQQQQHLLQGANFQRQPQTVPMLSPDVSHRPDHGMHQQQQQQQQTHNTHHHRRPKPKAPSSGARHTGPGGSLVSPRKVSSGASPRKVSSHSSPRKASGGSGSARSTTSPSPKPRQQLLHASRRSTSMQSLRDGDSSLSSLSSSATAAIRKRRSWASRPDLDMYALESQQQQQQQQQRRQTSSERPSAGNLSIGFVNYTAMDHDVLMAGVAPSGSSKTKARREKENREREDRMKEAFVQAVSAAGGDAGRFMNGLELVRTYKSLAAVNFFPRGDEHSAPI